MAATIMFSINANALLCFFFTTPTRFDMLKYGLIFCFIINTLTQIFVLYLPNWCQKLVPKYLSFSTQKEFV